MPKIFHRKCFLLYGKQAGRDWSHYSVTLEFIITYDILTFHCNWNKNSKLVQNCFCQRKCTAAATHNLKHMCYRELCSIGNIQKNFLKPQLLRSRGPLKNCQQHLKELLSKCNPQSHDTHNRSHSKKADHILSMNMQQ